jgi:hypothetical protein
MGSGGVSCVGVRRVDERLVLVPFLRERVDFVFDLLRVERVFPDFLLRVVGFFFGAMPRL